MGRSVGSLAVLIALTGVAHAGPKLFVARAESSVDWATRSQVEATVLGLARNVDRGASLGDASFSELASTLGCSGTVERCKAEVLETLAIDEVIVITITPAGDTVKVTVSRATKAGTRTATAIADKDKPEAQVTSGIGPLFGATRVVAPPKPPPTSAKPPTNAKPPASDAVVVVNEQPRRRTEPPPATEPAKAPPPPAPDPEPHTPAPVVTAEAEPTVTAAPNNVVEDRPRRGNALYAGGIMGGGALAIVGLVFWQKASSIEDEIQSSPSRTRADVDRLLDLESRGDRYALLGNIAVVGGVAIAGVSGFLYWRSRHDTNTVARVTPVVVDGGGGVAFTLEVP